MFDKLKLVFVGWRLKRSISKMETTKKWWQSKAVWAGIVTVLALFAKISMGVEIDAELQTVIVDNALSIVAALSSLIAIAGRLTAEKKIR